MDLQEINFYKNYEITWQHKYLQVEQDNRRHVEEYSTNSKFEHIGQNSNMLYWISFNYFQAFIFYEKLFIFFLFLSEVILRGMKLCVNVL